MQWLRCGQLRRPFQGRHWSCRGSRLAARWKRKPDDELDVAGGGHHVGTTNLCANLALAAAIRVQVDVYLSVSGEQVSAFVRGACRPGSLVCPCFRSSIVVNPVAAVAQPPRRPGDGVRSSQVRSSLCLQQPGSANGRHKALRRPEDPPGLGRRSRSARSAGANSIPSSRTTPAAHLRAPSTYTSRVRSRSSRKERPTRSSRCAPARG